jgi:hypothetical protein
MQRPTPFPKIGIALPGHWLQIPVGDTPREQALLETLRGMDPEGAQRAEALRRHLDQLARSGGDQVLLRQDELTLLTIAWPPGLPPPALFAGGQAAIESLRVEAGGEAEPVPSQHDYPIVRATAIRGEAQTTAYWLAHPVSARILLISVTTYAGETDVSVYDAAVGRIRWKDDDPLRKDG